ncbi:hypothetical protein DERF_000701 [Dermatophagoides farinae]|uniref:Uncharacterized protein n=1 Tax=Dermatophagoides farinae TaxID=6954 RepID=A0A922IAR1_DERFA|nr:hypothetical protein DERF_000701 [Dermatophagoides farinae]
MTIIKTDSKLKSINQSNAILASNKAKLVATHLRGPLPNGMNAILLNGFAVFSARKRSGINFSGSQKFSGSLCRSIGGIRMMSPFRTSNQIFLSLVSRRTSSTATRSITNTNVSDRIDSFRTAFKYSKLFNESKVINS